MAGRAHTSSSDTRATSGTKSERTDGDLQTLNFKVTPAFKKQFKGYAVEQGISMLELLREGFALSKERRSK